MESIWSDIKFAVRTLTKSPGFTAAAIVTLALGIGLNSAVFSLVNAVLLRPLPVERPDELITVWNAETSDLLSHVPLAYPDYVDLRDAARSVAGLIAYAMVPLALDVGGESQMVIAQTVSGNYFDLLGVRAVVGRTFAPEESAAKGTHPVAVLSHAAWRRRFGGAADVIGKTVRLNGNAFTVIGVAPQEFTGVIRGFNPELWVPLMMIPALQASGGLNVESGEAVETPETLDRLDRRRTRWLWVMGRLRPQSTVEQARAELQLQGRRLQEQYPDTNKDRDVVVLPAGEVKFLPGVDSVLYATSAVLLALVGMILLITSAKVANMLLARAAARRREIAVRRSLGASRLRLVRQLLTESLLLALAGAALGLLLAGWSNAVVNRVELPLPVELALGLTLDWRVLAFTLLVAGLAAAAFGLAPALQSSRSELVSALKDESGTTSAGAGRHRLRNALVVVQVTLSMVLLIGAGLSLRSMLNAHRVDPGFEPRGLLEASLAPSLQGYDATRAEQFYRQLAERVAALPGVASVATASALPLSFDFNIDAVSAEGQEPSDRKDWPEVDTAQVGPGFFETMRIPILRGRGFDDRDRPGAAPVAIVNQTLAQRFWPGADPIGKRLRFESEPQSREVVGVARSGKYRTLGEAPRPFVYRSAAQTELRDRTVLVRASGAPGALLSALRREIRQLDEKMPVTALRPVEEGLGVTLLLPRMGAALFGLFGVLGMILAAVGLYGVMAYMVSQRTREIGIRVAVGAQPRDILRLVLGGGLKLTAAGVALGIVGAIGLTRAIGVLLYGIRPTDPITFIGVAVLLLGTAALACFVPARRAARTDPLIALRHE